MKRSLTVVEKARDVLYYLEISLLVKSPIKLSIFHYTKHSQT